MLDHVGLDVSDINRSKTFYLHALQPLGYEIFMEWDKWVGFAIGGKPDFWLKQGAQTKPGIHIAFQAHNRLLVDQFYEAAIAAGGTDNGAPGIREIYHPHYYGAFVLDPDGHNIEVVCHESIVSENNLEKILRDDSSNKPLTMSVLMRKLDHGKSYQDFHEAWLPPVRDPSTYFDIPVIVVNGQNIQNPSEIVSVALVWADVQKAITSYQKFQATEDLREEKIGKITQQSIETRFCTIVDIEVLGS